MMFSLSAKSTSVCTVCVNNGYVHFTCRQSNPLCQPEIWTGDLQSKFAPGGGENKHLIPWSAPPLLGRGGVGHTIDRCITLNPGCQQVAVACSAATCKSMQRSITSNLSGNKVRDTSRSFNQGKR